MSSLRVPSAPKSDSTLRSALPVAIPLRFFCVGQGVGALFRASSSHLSVSCGALCSLHQSHPPPGEKPNEGKINRVERAAKSREAEQRRGSARWEARLVRCQVVYRASSYL